MSSSPKLSEDQVREILRSREASRVIAVRLGVSHGYVRSIRRGIYRKRVVRAERLVQVAAE